MIYDIYGSWSSHAMGIQTECVCKSLMKMDWWMSPNPNANTMLKVGMWTTTSMGSIESNLPPALGFLEQTSAPLRLIIARWPCFVSDGRRSPRRVRISFHIMVTSLQRLWSVADVSADVRASLGSASCLSADLFDGTLVGGVWVWGVGGCDNVLSTTFSSFFVILQHPTHSWCYVMELVLATSNTLLVLRDGTCSWCYLFGKCFMSLGWSVRRHVGWGVWVWGVGGCDDVLSTTFSSFFVILQHPTHSWCYVMELVLATSNTLLVLRDGTCSWCYLFGKCFMSLGWSVRRHVGWGGSGFGGGVGGWCDNVLSTTFLTFFVILQHPTRSWCYVMELVLATSNTNRVSWSSTRLQRPFHASPATKIWALYVLCSSFPLNGMSICCRLFKSVDEMSINGKCKAHILL